MSVAPPRLTGTEPAVVDVVERLRSSADIAAALRDGSRKPGRLAVVHARDAGNGPTRIAVVASRKVGTAVARNRAKRLLREAARHVSWRSGIDVVLVARSDCASARMGEVHADLVRGAVALGVAVPDAPASASA